MSELKKYNNSHGIILAADEEAISEWIDKQPTADVRENVRGEWRTTYLDHIAMGERPKILYCSICNQCIAYPTNYCPNCGADMRGDKQ